MVRNKQTSQPNRSKKGLTLHRAQPAPSTPRSGVVSQPTAEAVDKGKAKKQTYLDHVLSPEVLPSWLLFIVTSFGVYLALGTLNDLQKQTSAFHLTAAAAKKSADVAERALLISQRADILFNGAWLKRGEVNNIKDWRMEVEFKNFGLTRAKNVQLSLSLIIEGFSPSLITEPPVMMGPTGSKIIAFDGFYELLPENIATKIFQGQLPFRFEGKATYEDVFGNHHTTKCSGVLQPHTGFFPLDNEDAD